MKTMTQTNVQDISLNKYGDFTMLEGKKAYGIVLADAVRTVKGEIQIDSSIGLPYVSTAWENKKKEYVHYLKTLILSYEFVLEITKLEVEITSGGTLSYMITVETKDGSINLSSDTSYAPSPYPPIIENKTTILKIKDTQYWGFCFKRIGNRQVTVNWGDGTISKSREGESIEHTYKRYGSYTVEISDTISWIGFETDTVDFGSYRIDVSSLDRWGAHITSAKKSFWYCTSMMGPLPEWGESITDVSYAFWGCENITGPIPSWVQSITEAAEAFGFCTSMTGSIPAWSRYIENVTGCFEGCSGITGTIPPWGISITNSTRTYEECIGLTGTVPEWTDRMISAERCYQLCSGLVGSIPAWGNSMENANSTYRDCKGLSGIIPKWGNSLTDVTSVYNGCAKLTGAWTRDQHELMPESIIKHESAVYGTDYLLRNLFLRSWGGTQSKIKS